MTHDNVRDALEYAAALLEQEDAGGTLPGTLRKIADSHDDLLTACEGLIKYRDSAGPLNFQLEKADDFIDLMRVNIAAARGIAR
jgi:hypothetical protein